MLHRDTTLIDNLINWKNNKVTFTYWLIILKFEMDVEIENVFKFIS